MFVTYVHCHCTVKNLDTACKMWTLLLSTLLLLHANSGGAGPCAGHTPPFPDPGADCLLSGTVQWQEKDGHTYAVHVYSSNCMIQELVPRQCWEDDGKLLRILQRSNTTCVEQSLTIDKLYLFSLRFSQSSCPVLASHSASSGEGYATVPHKDKPFGRYRAVRQTDPYCESLSHEFDLHKLW